VAGPAAGFPRTGTSPQTGTASVHVLQAGYARAEADGEHVGSTVTLIRDGDVAIIVDPGLAAAEDPFAPDPGILAASRARILGIATVIIRGHGPAFVPDDTTAR
jgi:hypothetical protein